MVADMSKGSRPPAELEAFRETAQSLKLYRRADLPGPEGKSLIEELYVDPLPNDHVLNTMVKPNTTFIVGRKGTGKSTVFLRAQHELRKDEGVASAYIDIKTVYESSQADPQLIDKVSGLDGTMSPDEIKRLLLYRNFLGAVVKDIREELEKRIKVSLWTKVKRSVGGTLPELFKDFDALIARAHDDQFMSVIGMYERKATDRSKVDRSDEDGLGIELTAGASPSVSLSGHATSSYNTATEEERTYADVLMRVFDIRAYITELRSLLEKVSISHLYVFVDDFSELPPDAMKVVVDSIIGPLNNWSDELIKFKIAAYPGRIYYGPIDKTKIDEINLDLFALYGTTELSTMEEKAVDFTQRLIERRLRHFGVKQTSRFLATEYQRNDEVWRQLFFATMANPRNLGYVLYFIYESELLYGRSISLTSIRDAARRYYEEKIEADFNMKRFLHETFEERSSIFSLKELLDDIVSRARDLRANHSSSLMREIPGRPPTSHFHVVTALDPLLATLELNFFMTKYFVMKDRDGHPVTVFALNYGLCQKETIEFGRPSGKREHRYRSYYVERVFDYTPILQQYLKTNQEISCKKCGATFGPEALQALTMYGMRCPECGVGTCTVTNLSRKYEATLRAVDEQSLLPQVDLGIIHTLGTEREPQVASNVAGELDCSYQMIGKRAKMLADRGLVNRNQFVDSRRVFSITDAARTIYMESMEDSASPEA
jgi:Cdc6-like AAA superfamily ATPase